MIKAFITALAAALSLPAQKPHAGSPFNHRVFELQLGGKSFGTGFLVRYPDAVYLVTAAHVVSKIVGRARKLGKSSAASLPPLRIRTLAADDVIDVFDARFAICADREVAWIRLPESLTRRFAPMAWHIRTSRVADEEPLRVLGHPWARTETTAPYVARGTAKPTRYRIGDGGLQFYWTTCASKGFSGGPVFDNAGHVVGLHLGRIARTENMWFFLLGGSFRTPPGKDKFAPVGTVEVGNFWTFYESIGLDKSNLHVGESDSALSNTVHFTDLDKWLTNGTQGFLTEFSLAQFTLPAATGNRAFGLQVNLPSGRLRRLSINGRETKPDAALQLSPGRNILELRFENQGADPYTLGSYFDQQRADLQLSSRAGFDLSVSRSLPEAVRRWSVQTIVDVPEQHERTAALVWDPAALRGAKDVGLVVPLKSDDPATGAAFQGKLTVLPLDDTRISVRNGFFEIELTGALDVQQARVPVFGGSVELEPVVGLRLRGRLIVYSGLAPEGERLYFRLAGLQLSGTKVEIPLGKLGDQTLKFDATRTLTTTFLLWLNNVWLTQISVPISGRARLFLRGLSTASSVKLDDGRFRVGGVLPPADLERDGSCMKIFDASGMNSIRLTPKSIRTFVGKVLEAKPTDIHDFTRKASDLKRLRKLVHWTFINK